MKFSNVLPALLLALAAACATTSGVRPHQVADLPADLAVAGPAPVVEFAPERDRDEFEPLGPGAAAAQGDEIWNDPDFARRFAESYLAETDIEPPVTPEERDVLLEVFELRRLGKLEQAMALVDGERNPASNAVFDYTFASLLVEQEELYQAATNYQIAIKKFPKFRRAWDNLARIHFRQGNHVEAVRAFTRVIELGGADGLMFGMLGMAHSSLGDDLAAESAFRQATMLEPRKVEWKFGMAESFFKQRRYADAVALFDRLIVEQPNQPRFWLAQGEAYARLQQPRKAAENFEIVDRLGGATVTSLQNLGNIYANEKLFDLAVNAYRRAMEKNTETPVGRVILAAQAISRSGAHAETLELIDAIETIQGHLLTTEDRTELLRIRARTALAQGAGDEEARILEQIVELDPLDGDALILLGEHSRRAGDPEKAVFYFERAAQLEKFEARAKVAHAQLLVGESKYGQALPLLRRAQTVDYRENVQTYLEQIERIAQSR